MANHVYRKKWPPLNVGIFITHVCNLRNGFDTNDPLKHGEKKHLICQSSQFIIAYDNHCLCVYIKKVSHLPSQLGIFVFTFTAKHFHIYGALLHLALKVFTFTGPYYIFTFRGATGIKNATDKNIIFASLNDGLVKSLLKISYWVFIACDEIPKRHFTATFYTTRWKHKMWR